MINLSYAFECDLRRRLADYEKAVAERLSPDEHYRTIEALEFSIDPERKIIPTLDKLRRKRNVGAYDDYGLVSQNEADTCGKMAVRVRKDVEDWIRTNYADKLG
jgi:hypothetical protein